MISYYVVNTESAIAVVALVVNTTMATWWKYRFITTLYMLAFINNMDYCT